ncbi:response regulator transcription factor, partial [Actinomyces naeslundii]
MIHTLIVDNDMLFRAGIRMMIDSSSDITVAGEATTGLEALDMIQATNVDIVLMDISIPQLNGVEATKKIVDIPNCPKILILTSYGMDEELFNALAAGATGFLLKDSPPEGLLTAISSAYNGNAVISPQ